MRHFLFYHNVDKKGPYDLDMFEGRHTAAYNKRKTVINSQGQTMWVITGQKQEKGPKRYTLVARLSPTTFEQNEYGDFTFWAVGKQFPQPITLLDETRLLALKQATANLVGYAELKSPVLIEWLTSLLPSTFVTQPATSTLYPDELEPDTVYLEGAKKQVLINAYERNQKARDKCIAHWGAVCQVCALDFEQRYGPVGQGFIHVHHSTPLATIGHTYELDAIHDLVPVCPNCHAMLHKRDPAYKIHELKAMMTQIGRDQPRF